MKFLLCVGAEKAGTTWLFEYFRHHPEFYDVGKELNVIQRDDLIPTFPKVSDSFKKDLGKYFRYFQQLNQVSGDFTHYEGSTENVFRLLKDGLKQYDIDIVPVYIMRDPIERAWSAWYMLHQVANARRHNHTDILSFDMPGAAAVLTHNYLQCKYKETVQALDSVFSKPLYFFYEEFFNQESLDTICNALDIPTAPGNFTERVNASKYISNAIPEEFINTFCITDKNLSAIEFLKGRFGNVPWDLTHYERK